MTRSADYSAESVVVVGGGLAGCFVACELRRLGYGEVVVLERLGNVCEVGPRVISELHAGGEYPFDGRSAVDCLHGLAVLHRRLPTGVFTKPRTHMLLSTGTARAELDAEGYAAHLTMLQREYERMVRADPALEQEICPVSDFWRQLDPSEYADVSNVEAGFETPQRGVQPHLLSQLVLANHARGFTMMADLADDEFAPPPVYLGLRMMVLVEHSVHREFPAPTRLMLEGHFGAMDAPIEARQSLVYYPPRSHLSLVKLEPPYRLPDSFARRVTRWSVDDLSRAREIVAGAAAVAYPYLGGSTVIEPRLAIAVNEVADSRVRRNVAFLKPTRDCVSLTFSTKATTTALKPCWLPGHSHSTPARGTACSRAERDG